MFRLRVGIVKIPIIQVSVRKRAAPLRGCIGAVRLTLPCDQSWDCYNTRSRGERKLAPWIHFRKHSAGLPFAVRLTQRCVPSKGCEDTRSRGVRKPNSTSRMFCSFCCKTHTTMCSELGSRDFLRGFLLQQVRLTQHCARSWGCGNTRSRGV